MLNLTNDDKALVAEMVEERLGRLDSDFPNDPATRAKTHIRLLRIVRRAYRDEPKSPTLQRILAAHNIPVGLADAPPAVNADEEADEEEEVEEEEEEEEEEVPAAAVLQHGESEPEVVQDHDMARRLQDEENVNDARTEIGEVPLEPEFVSNGGCDVPSADAADDVPAQEKEEAPPVPPEADQDRERGFQFEEGRIYRSTMVMLDGLRIAAGHGFSSDNNGGRFYTSSKGRRHDMKKPPPGRCFNCDGNHWRIDCPYAIGNTTIF